MIRVERKVMNGGENTEKELPGEAEQSTESDA